MVDIIKYLVRNNGFNDLADSIFSPQIRPEDKGRLKLFRCCCRDAKMMQVSQNLRSTRHLLEKKTTKKHFYLVTKN